MAVKFTDETPELNITPLVDIMLVLLAILMVTMPTITYQEDITLPDGSKAKTSTSKQKDLIVSINSQGLSVEDIIKSIEAKVADLESFYKKLFSYGYKANFQAELLKFKIDKILFFNVDNKFPKITSIDIDSRIHNVKYTVDLLKCNEFLLDKIKL